MMDIDEVKTVLRNMLTTPLYLARADEHIGGLVPTKGFLLGLGIISTDSTEPNHTLRLISFIAIERTSF